MTQNLYSFILCLFLGLTVSSSSYAQETVATSNEESPASSSNLKPYIGFSGGYLFKNKSILESPMWHLNDGMFLELNGGIKKGYFGWDLSLGYLNLKRDVSQFEKFTINTQRLLDEATPSELGQVISGFDQNTFSFGPDNHSSFEHQPFKGFYLMTGPSLWLGEGNFKVNIGIEAGLGMSQVGYYHLAGNAATPEGATNITVTDGQNNENNYLLELFDVNYKKSAMSKKFSDQLSSSTLGNPFDEKQPYELHFIGRASANLEYFVHPSISLHAGANFWYIKSPEMIGGEEVSGLATFTHESGRNFKQDFKYTENYAEKDLMFLSANAGLKFWFGGAGKSKSSGSGSSSDVKDAGDNKNQKIVVVNIVDELTKTPIGGADVKLINKMTKNTLTATTKDNGVAMFHNINPADYEVLGNVYGIETTEDKIKSKEFQEQSGDLYRTLYYQDARFILKGVALNADTRALESGVKVNLERGSDKVAHTATQNDGSFQFILNANSDYEVQGLKDGLYSNIEDVSTKGLDRSQTLYVKLHLGLSNVEVGKSFVIKNILYDFDDDAIRKDASIELNRLVAFLNENPNIRIELSSHTDSRGNNNYNLNLSQRRAKSAVNYLISKGINSNRLVAKGYGETRLTNACADGVSCSEAEHQANRRTEIQIIE